MTHTYELRKLEDDNSITTVLMLNATPKQAKQKAAEYAKEHPGLYSLVKLETVKIYFTEKN